MILAQKILREAAEIVRQRGWTRGTFQAGDDSVCALGALRLAAFGTATPKAGLLVLSGHPNKVAYDRARRKLQKTMLEQLEGSCFLANRGIMCLNDRAVQSGEELIGYMEKAANNLDA